jgi:hyperosmotically inducible protein
MARTERLILMMSLVLTVGCAQQDASDAARDVRSEVTRAAARAGETLGDAFLTARVQARFFADEAVKARYLDVSSRDGTVTVGGFVESDAVRQRVLAIARDTDGVRAVTDALLIGRRPEPESTAARRIEGTEVPATGTTGAGPTPDDATVESLIQARYFLDPRIKVRTIEVDAEQGVVTLRGTVASDDERAEALALARATEGVSRVEDGLTVDAAVP